MWWLTGVWTKHSTTISIFSPSCMTNMCLILTVLYVCDAFWLLDVFVCDKNWNKMNSEEDKQALGVKTHKLIFWKFSPDWQVHQSIRLGYGEWHSHLPSIRALMSSNQIRTCCCRMGRTHSQLKDPKVQASHWCDHAHYSFLRWADWHLQLVNPILPTSCFLSLVQNKKSLYLNQFWHYSLKSQLHIRAWLILFSQLLVDPGHQVVKNKEDQDHPHGDVTQDTAVVSSWSDHGGETFHAASEQACRTHEVWVLKERGDNSLIIHNKLT